MRHLLADRTWKVVLVAGFVAVVVAALVIAKVGGRSESERPWSPGIAATYCWFDATSLAPIAPHYTVDCAWLKTQAEPGRFTLPVVVFRYRGEDRRADPLIYLSGGPGNSSFLEAHNIDGWFYWLAEAGLARDVILADQRGTGLSFPQHQCHDYTRFVRHALGDSAREAEADVGFTTVNDCIERLQHQGFVATEYSTTLSVADMHWLMTELGYRQWNVMGVSYGSRMALDWLRREPDSIRALILDSVYPLDKGALTEWPRLMHDALARFWRACRAGVVCELADRDGEALFWQAMAVVKAQPIALRVTPWQDDWPMDVLVDDFRLLNLVHYALNDETLYPAIVAAIREIANGDEPRALARLARAGVSSELAPEFNVITYLAVNCAEIPRVSRDAYQRARAEAPDLMAYTDMAWDYDYCASFSVRADLDAFRAQVSSDVPALIAAGEFDPVTPPGWAEEVAATLPNSQLFLQSGLGHGVIGRSPCLQHALRAFLDDPSEPIDADCAAERGAD